MFEKFKLARDVAAKNWQQPAIWSVNHPLNRGGFLGSGITGDTEQIENDFEGYVNGAYKTNGPVFACITARQYVFSEAKLKFRSQQDGKLFGTTALDLLDTPWPGGTTGNLLSRMEQDASLAGNSWWTTTDDAGRFGKLARGPGLRICHMRPDWVSMVVGSKSGDPFALDAKLVGVMYRPRQTGTATGVTAPPVLLTMAEVAHYCPIPDPIARFRGMSWITPILKEIEGDKGATQHKKAFFDNAAVPNLAVSFGEDTNEDDFNEFVESFRANHESGWNAYRTLFLMGGADVKPLTHDFKQMDFSQTIGKGESRIASAAGVPPSWVGFSEGLQGSSLNAGNMAANRRRFADGTIRPLWREAVASLAVLVAVPAGAELWWDESDIAFLREDQRDRAEIMRIDMNAVDAGIKSGYEPDAVVDAVAANDIRKLIGKHTGLVSVQMQPPVRVDKADQMAELEHANLLAVQANILAALAPFFENPAEALEAEDWTKLVPKPEPKPTAPAPTPKPGTDNPGGGGNG